MAITFDTLAYANKLKSAGVPAEQAEAQAEALAQVENDRRQDLATKLDIAELKSEMLVMKWMIGFTLAFVVAITTIKLFIH